MSTFDLYAKIRNLRNQAKDLQEQAANEDRELNTEELVSFEKYFNDIVAIEKQIELENKYAQIDSSKGDPFYDKEGKQVGDKGTIERKWQEAFSRFLRTPTNQISTEDREILEFTKNPNGVGVPIDPTGELRKAWRQSNIENRATNSAITNPTYLNPVTLAAQFAQTLRDMGPWMDAVTIINDNAGNDLVLPYYDDAGNDGADESAGSDAIASSTDLNVAKVTLTNYWTSSTGIKASWATLRDANYPVNEFIVDPLMKRLARRISYRATQGTGSSVPKGIAICAVPGEVAAKATTPTATDMNNLLGMVDFSYHTGLKSGWMFNSDTMFKIAATVKSTTYNTEPLWMPSLAAGIPSTLYGYKYWINNSMDKINTNLGNSILFGDFSYFILRMVGPTIITKLEERYAELGQVGFLISQFMDSNVKAVGTTYAPFKKIRNIIT